MKNWIKFHTGAGILWVLAVSGLLSNVQAHRTVETYISGQLVLEDQTLKYDIAFPHFQVPVTADWPVTMQETDLTAEQREQLLAYIRSHFPIEVNRIPVQPELLECTLTPRIEYLYLDRPKTFLGVSLKLGYSLSSEPQLIHAQWPLYPEEPASGWDALIDPDQDPYEFFLPLEIRGQMNYLHFLPDEPDAYWHAAPPELPSNLPDAPASLPPAALALALTALVLFALSALPALRRSGRILRLGALAALLCGMALPVGRMVRTADIEPAFRSLHTNLYRAFEYQKEEEIYRALSASVSDELLESIYLQIYRSLILTEANGAISQIQGVEIQELETESGGFLERLTGAPPVVQCTWDTEVFVEHWGHIHRRVNRSSALFHLIRERGAWKIRSIDILEQERVPLVRESGT